MKFDLKTVRHAHMPALIAAAIGCVCAVSVPNVRAADFSGSVALTTDYVWRGISQTESDPAVQAGASVSWKSGLYASIWGSNVEYAGTDASSELDFVVGWGRALGDDWTVDANILHYRYPGTTVDLDWTELNGKLTYRDRYFAAFGWSHEALGYDASGTYALIGATFPLNDAFRLEASAAHYFLDKAVVAEEGYSHGSLSAVWTFKAPFELRLSAHATDSNAETIFGEDFAGNRIEAALQASF